MKDWNTIPRRGYVLAPTPLEEARRFSQAMGGRIRIKRDDLLPFGGNKTRKLDYILEEAVRLGADTLITASTNQCCHNSILALLANREGLGTKLVMESWGDPRYQYASAANYEMLSLCGVEQVETVTDLPTGLISEMPLLQKMAEKTRQAGGVPYFVSRGGAGPLGAMGYVRCAAELAEQWGADVPGAVVCPCGIGGTQAGLTVGLRLQGVNIPVIGIGVTGKSRAQMEESVRAQCRELTDFLECAPIAAEAVRCVEDYSGPGYGKPFAEQLSVMKLLAKTEGILTDPVYSGKALAGLMEQLRDCGPGGLIFLHTGGLQLFYDFSTLRELEAWE